MPFFFRVNLSEHPRLLFLEGQEQEIKEQGANNVTWAKMHQAICDEDVYILIALCIKTS